MPSLLFICYTRLHKTFNWCDFDQHINLANNSLLAKATGQIAITFPMKRLMRVMLSMLIGIPWCGKVPKKSRIDMGKYRNR